MNALSVGLANHKTTLVGAGVGSLFYADNIGFRVPANETEWISFAISVLLAVLGLLAKDATTGSRPS